LLIELPYPPKELNPNKRLHWAKKHKFAKKYKQDCLWLLKAQKPPVSINMVMALHPPCGRRRDVDNCIASLKYMIDALSDYWGVDDSEFEILWPTKFSEPVKKGVVLIEL